MTVVAAGEAFLAERQLVSAVAEATAKDEEGLTSLVRKTAEAVGAEVAGAGCPVAATTGVWETEGAEGLPV